MASRPRTIRKVGVLTFHRSINYGSYWQARCLVEGLRARGHDAELLDHRSRCVDWREARNAFQPTLPARTDPRHFAALGRKTRAMIAAVDALPLSPPFPLEDPAASPRYDAVVVGSDEVWNFRHPWFSGASIFFGNRLNTDRLVSYAASFGNHDAADGVDNCSLDRLRRFHAISVRDENSRALLAPLAAHHGSASDGLPLVLDPCLQFPRVVPEAAPTGAGSYAIVYGHSFPDWFAAQLRRWADRTGTRLVAIGYPSDIADEARIDADPAEFASLFAGARAVVTNFFHGCVFAIRHNRPFVCAASPYRRNKVQDLTRVLGLEHHLVSEGVSDADIADRLGALPTTLADRLAEQRAASARFLDHALA
ncbi:polysaccharide pyruvyl transferase family protein [Sphingomonas sp.]|jgi:hypothetical protein|uniref:polysaccharide pyruvyl transferase family protein n=1 Tax=Sphingomonas sp. TaxID=28214 RepID=UPI00262FB121|nr:polysaccharide pyruvyl transferase family protein [Sphingomonas sp.]MDF2495620.1 polysaccharide pyruvyl transferase family protein [Sphingomonas sp.]